MPLPRVSQPQLLANIGATFGTKILAALVSLATSVVITRALGPEGRGVFASTVALAAIGVQLGNLGLTTSNTYFLARQPELLRQLIGNSLAAAVAFGLLAMVAIAAVAVWTGQVQQLGPQLLLAAMLTVPVGLAYTLLQNLLLAIARVAAFNWIEIGLRVCSLLFVGAAVLIGLSSPLNLYWATVITQCLAAALILFTLKERRFRVSFDLLRAQVPFAFRSYLTCLLSFLLIRADLLMVEHFSGNAEAGQYSIAVSMADMIFMLPTAAGAIAFPKLSESADRSTRNATTLSLLVHVGWSVALISSLAAIVARPAVRLLFGAAFAPAVPMFYILAGAAVPMSLATILSVRLASEGFPWSSAWVWLAALIINIGLNLLWIPHYGGNGAAFASLVAYSVALPLQVIALRCTASDDAAGLLAPRTRPLPAASDTGSSAR